MYRVSAEARAAREERTRRALALVEGGLFASGPPAVRPTHLSSLEIRGFEELAVGCAPGIWLSGIPGGHMPIAGFRRLNKLPKSCYVISTLQALLRVPAVAAWLDIHCQHCTVEASSEDLSRICCACVLWRSRAALGTLAIPELVLRRDLAGKCFHDLNQHDIVAFIGGLLEALRGAEREVSRCAPLQPG